MTRYSLEIHYDDGLPSEYLFQSKMELKELPSPESIAHALEIEIPEDADRVEIMQWKENLFFEDLDACLAKLQKGSPS